ncbi:hypothetical protein EJB05_45435, partial [Eragrostis curvula]
MARRIVAVPVILLMIMAFMAVSGTARPFGGDVWTPAREGVSGEGVMQFLQQMYLQRLGAGPSCGTNSSNVT